MCDNYFDELSPTLPPLPEIIHLLPGNENGLNLESLDNGITFHARTCKAEGCYGPCNHDGKTDVDTSYNYVDSSLPSSDVSLSWNESVSVSASSVVDIANLKQQFINTIHDKLATFPACLRDALIERARSAKIGEVFYWCQGLCKSLMSGESLGGVDR